MASFFDKLKKGMKVEKLIDASNDSVKKMEEITEKTEARENRNKEKGLVEFLALPEEEEKKKKKRSLLNSTRTAVSLKNRAENKKKKKMKKENKTEKIEEKKGRMKKIEVKDKEDEKFTFSSKTKKKIDKKWFEPEGELTVDIYQTDKDIVIQSVIAGITPKDIDISIENDMVIIRGNREKPFGEEKRKYFFKECYWGRFSREIVLPEEVDNSRAQASLKNGILTIRIPKIERSKKRKITIEE